MSIYIYILVMAVTTYLIRALPLTVFRKPIKSRFLRSFLHYVPTACLIAFRILAAVSIASERAALASVQSEKLRLLKVFNVVFVSIIAFSVVCFFLSNASFAVTSCSEASPCA